jgi:predicted component of type VI protein secretion system
MLPLVVTVLGTDGSTRRYAFAESPVAIGRSPFTDLQLTESFVSRWEGTLRFDSNEVTYFSLGSTNPTFVNGRQVEAGEDTLLPADATVTIGELTLKFTREPVAESDIRRKGKPKPVHEGHETSLKTAYLDLGPRRASISPSAPPDAAEAGSSPPPDPRSSASSYPPPDPRAFASSPPAVRVYPSHPPRSHLPSTPPPSVPPVSQRPEGVRLLGRVTVIGVGGTSERESAPSRPPSSLPPNPGWSPAPPASEWPSPPTYREEPRPASRAEPATTTSLYGEYRASWRRLLQMVSSELEQLPHHERANHLERVQRAYPECVHEPEFEALLTQHGLGTKRSDVPEIAEWLKAIARDVLPPKVQIDTGLTLDRILGLLETLTQSLGEINDAQNTVRQRWLGRQPRRSVLRSDNGRAILAYLLNPQANWNERLHELEQTIRHAVTHELALFQATIEGARMLVNSISPEAIAQHEQVDLEELEGEARSPALWGRFRGKEAPEVRLWRAFVKAHETLMDSDRYQRVFLGRVFAKTYLAAMGQGEQGEKRPG